MNSEIRTYLWKRPYHDVTVSPIQHIITSAPTHLAEVRRYALAWTLHECRQPEQNLSE